MTRFISCFLLTCFGISLVIFPSMEATHELLHHFENRFHHHHHGDHHGIADHHIHHSHSHDGTQAENETETSYVPLAFVFFHPEGLSISPDEHTAQRKYDVVLSFYQSLNPVPLTSPPLA